jgi:phosphoglycerate dehydrogenase-like enzyme
LTDWVVRGLGAFYLAGGLAVLTAMARGRVADAVLEALTGGTRAKHRVRFLLLHARYYDRDADLNLIKGKKVAIVGYGSQGRPCAEPARFRRQGRRVALRKARHRQEGRGRRPQGDDRRRSRQVGRPDDDG